MLWIPLLDMGWGVAVYFFGLISLAIVVPVTIGTEAAVIKAVLKLPFGRALKDSIVMNLASGLLGLVSLVIFAPILTTENYFGETYYYDPPQEVVPFAFLKVMGMFCVISIIVEGFILSAMERHSPLRIIWLIVFISNLVSYSGMLLVFVGLTPKIF